MLLDAIDTDTEFLCNFLIFLINANQQLKTSSDS